MHSKLTAKAILIALIVFACGNVIAQKEAWSKPPQLKYHLFGLHSLNGKIADSLQQALGVRIVNNGCTLDKKKLAENKKVDSIMRQRYGSTLPEILRTLR